MRPKHILAAASLVISLALGSTGAMAAFGAIAYSPSTGGYGFSYGFNGRGGAEREAMAQCNARASGCEIAIWFTNACGAVAVGNNGGWGSAWGMTRAQAESKAVSQCRRFTGNCRPLAWACSG